MLYYNRTYLNFHIYCICIYGEFSEPNSTFNLLLLPDEKIRKLFPTHEISVAGEVTRVIRDLFPNKIFGVM